MVDTKRIVVVLPAYNSAMTLEKTYSEIDRSLVDEVILVDDASDDATVEHSRKLGIRTVVHHLNRGYGGNQKTCYAEALRCGADIVVMLHPDYQYSPRLIPAMVAMITSGHYDIVIGSRILGKMAVLGGMPRYKYVSNRILTLLQNILMSQKLTEYHTGYRAFTRDALESLAIEDFSDDFVFDNQIIAQALYLGLRIGEISCPTRYAADSSSISFRRSAVYGLGVLRVSLQYFLARTGVCHSRVFPRRPSALRGGG